MNSRPGRLTGGHIRELPGEMRRELLRDVKSDTGKSKRLVSARYRVTGYRNGAGAWVARDAKLGNYAYKGPKGGRRRVKPAADVIRRSPVVAVEVELDRGRGPKIYYTTIRPFDGI
jgi:hypothetical protein